MTKKDLIEYTGFVAVVAGLEVAGVISKSEASNKFLKLINDFMKKHRISFN